jgi:RNA polymerase sigma-70 factor, ECF subfamily
MELIPPTEDVSAILQAWSEGDPRALDRLTPIVYDELHRLARRYMRQERPGHGLQTTALVHEAYLRLVGYTRMRWQNRAHFFAVSAQVMRRVLVDYARRQNLKRGGGLPHLSLDDGEPCRPEPLDRILALHDALDALTTLDPRKARVVELRFFGGLTVQEVGEVLEISAVTVMRDWSSAKAWLYRELGGGAADGS